MKNQIEPTQCEKCEGYGAIEGKYCDCSSGQMAVRDALNRGDHVAVAFNHETGKKDVFVDRKHKPKVARAEPSRGAPSWSKMMAEMQTCGHTNAQHLYHDSGDIKIDLSACLVHTSIEHAGQTSGGTTADVAKAASAAPDASRGAPDAIAKLRAARTAWHEEFGVPISQEYANFLTAIGEVEDGHVVLLEALRGARLKLFYIGNLATNAHFDQANLEPVLKRIVAFANDGQAEAEAAIKQVERT